MNEKLFEARLAEIAARIDTLPDEQRRSLMKKMAETRRRHHDLREALQPLRDALADWSTRLHYLLFDCEASRRERQAIRRRLEQE